MTLFLRTLFAGMFLSFLLSGPAVGDDALDLSPVEKWIASQASLESLYGTFVEERQLRTVRKPLTKEGSFWYQKPGRVRWQTGVDPIDRIAIKNDTEVLLIQPKKGEVDRQPLKGLEENERFKGLSFLEAGFPTTLEGFLAGFQVTGIVKEEDYYVVETKLRDSKASLALTKMVFYIHESDYQLKSFKMFLRGKSTIYTRFTALFPNKAFDAAVFTPDLSSFQD